MYLKPKNLTNIVGIIKQGNVVALPTDTIFGLVCLANDQNAIDKIYQIKNRSIKKALPILAKNWKQAATIGIFSNQLIEYLQNNFLKGQVTAVVERNPNFSKIDYWNKWDTVAVRVTNSRLIKKIINKTGPLVATSCNISNEKPINNAKEINLPNLKYIVEGNTVNKKASAIYDSLNKKILRQ